MARRAYIYKYRPRLYRINHISKLLLKYALVTDHIKFHWKKHRFPIILGLKCIYIGLGQILNCSFPFVFRNWICLKWGMLLARLGNMNIMCMLSRCQMHISLKIKCTCTYSFIAILDMPWTVFIPTTIFWLILKAH